MSEMRFIARRASGLFSGPEGAPFSGCVWEGTDGAGHWVWVATSLKDITSLVEAEDERVIIGLPEGGQTFYTITIYDDWME